MLLFSRSVVSDSFATPWTVAPQVPLSVGFLRQECWSGLQFPPPGDLPTQESNPGFLPCRRILDNLRPQRSPQLRRTGKETRSLAEGAFGRKPGIALVPRGTEGQGRWSCSEPLPRPGPTLRIHTIRLPPGREAPSTHPTLRSPSLRRRRPL